MKCLVIGFGSAGQRHARILKALGHDVEVLSKRCIGRFRNSTKDALAWEPDYCVVASKTKEHMRDLSRMWDSGARILVEKPLFDKPSHCWPRDDVFVGYNLRFHPVVRELRDRIAGRELYTAHFHVGQWLPTWRPDRNYRETDVNGVLRDLSHELDMMLWLCGWPTKLYALAGKASGLDIECEDSASILCSTEHCPQTVITLNYLDHDPHRWIAVNYDGGTVMADLVHNTITETTPAGESHTQAYSVDKDQTYRDMHQAMITGKDADVLCSLEQGLAVVNLITLIESATHIPYEVAA